MKMFRTAICLALVCVVSASGIADEKKGKGKGGARKAPGVTQRFVAKMELTDEQKEKVAAIDKQFAAKAQVLNKQRTDILTDEQKQAQKDATKAAKDAGKTPAEARKSVQAALKLTDDQSAKMKEHGKVQSKLNEEVLVELKKVLTAEQQEMLPKARGAAADGEKKGKGKRKKDAA